VESYDLAEYDRTGVLDPIGYYEHFTAASPYYYAVFMEAFTTEDLTSFTVSPGTSYLSRSQIPTSDDFKRIDSDAFLSTTLIRDDQVSSGSAGGPLLTATNWGDNQTRYYAVHANTNTSNGRIARNWAKGTEWQKENPYEYFSGSYVSVTCPALWSYNDGLTVGTRPDFDWGFGSGNPMTVFSNNTPAGLSSSYQIDFSAGTEISVVYDLGTDDTLEISEVDPESVRLRDGETLLSLVGPVSGVQSVISTTGQIYASYKTNSADGYGYRAVFDESNKFCSTTGDANVCENSCIRERVCSGDFMKVSALNNFDFSSCCSDKWGPQCALGADAVYWAQVCAVNEVGFENPELNSPYIVEEPEIQKLRRSESGKALKSTKVSFGKKASFSSSERRYVQERTVRDEFAAL